MDSSVWILLTYADSSLNSRDSVEVIRVFYIIAWFNVLALWVVCTYFNPEGGLAFG